MTRGRSGQRRGRSTRHAPRLAVLLMLLTACGPSGQAGSTPSPSVQVSAQTPSTSPSRSPVTTSGQATATPSTSTFSVLLESVPSGTLIAVRGDRIFVAQVMVGVRAIDTRAQLASLATTGGTLTVVGGTSVAGTIGGLLGDNSLYVSVGSDASEKDNYVYRLDATDSRLVLAGGGAPAGSNGDGGPAVNARLQGPTGLAMNSGGALFIAEHGANRIRRVDAGTISTFAGNGSCAAAPLASQVPAAQAAICGPQLLALDRDGNLYVAQVGGAAIVRVDTAGRLSTVATASAISALRAGRRGEVLFADTAAGGRLVALEPTGTQTVMATGLGGIRDIAIASDTSIYILHNPDLASPRIQLSRLAP